MAYETRVERENWVSLPEALICICRFKNIRDEKEARRQLKAALVDGNLWPLRWKKERGDQAAPFGFTPVTTSTDTPPRGHAWSEAKIRWSAGRVRDDWDEYKNGKWRVLLIHPSAVARCVSPSPESTRHADSDSKNVMDFPRRKRGRIAKVTPEIEQKMKDDLDSKRFTPESLAAMTEEALRAEYGGSRDTCRKARERVLSSRKLSKIKSS
jgi:Bacterial regulatory proteins, gntR family